MMREVAKLVQPEGLAADKIGFIDPAKFHTTADIALKFNVISQARRKRLYQRPDDRRRQAERQVRAQRPTAPLRIRRGAVVRQGRRRASWPRGAAIQLREKRVYSATRREPQLHAQRVPAGPQEAH